jgi:phage terminase large subunit-like protein
MLFGGSRSGKTFTLVRAVIVRALKAENSRHIILRFRFNHIKSSIVMDTLPKVIKLCWPGLWEKCKLDRTDWYLTLPNGSEIWFGGLDDKERTEKILGQEYATIYLNECSQISWAARNMAMTRLAQRCGLTLKAYYDCNPPGQSHWSYRVFVKKIDPDSKESLPNQERYASLLMNPGDNTDNLPEEYIQELQALPERMRQRFLDGKFLAANDNALWSVDTFDRCRILDGNTPDYQRIVIAVDPSGSSGDEDERSDEVGIVVCALGTNGLGYLIEDLSGKYKPEVWGNIVGQAFDRHKADCVVAEKNFGGDMVRAVIQAARPNTPYKAVNASRGKAVRAEPISYLYPSKIKHVGYFPEIEDQLTEFTTSGYVGDRSPDRADALVWGMTELFPQLTRKPAKKKPARKVYASAGGWMG